MDEINEEQILLENKSFQYLFDFDFINGGLYISVFHKKKKEFLVEQHEITNFQTIYQIKKVVDKPIGSTFKKGGLRYIVRNHDKLMWNENRGNYKVSTEGYLFDNRMDVKSLPIIPRLITNLKLGYIEM